MPRILFRHVTGFAILVLASVVTVLAQSSTLARAIDYSDRPIVERLKPGERQVRLLRHVISEPIDIGRQPFEEALDQYNSLIVIARVTNRTPEFMHFRVSPARYAVTSETDATWIGSRITLQVERVIKAPAEMRVAPDDRVTYVTDSDGSAVINGVRVDAETEQEWPIQQGKRYLVTGNVEEESSSSTVRFVPSGMWLEPFDGAPLRGPSRTPLTPDNVQYKTVPTFERNGSVPPNIDEAADRLQAIARKRTEPAPRRSWNGAEDQVPRPVLILNDIALHAHDGFSVGIALSSASVAARSR